MDVGRHVRCTFRIDSICGVDPQGLNRLAGSVPVSACWDQQDLVTLEACRLGFVKLLPE